MARAIIEPLRDLNEAERQELVRVSIAFGETVRRQMRAEALLAVASGASLSGAARKVGWQVGDTVAALIRRFNRRGLSALDDQPHPGRRRKYGPAERERIVREFRRQPNRDEDGTATWSVELLKRALRQASDGLPEISGFTIIHVFTRRDSPGRRVEPGVTREWPCVSAKMASSKSPTPRPTKKRGASSRHTG